MNDGLISFVPREHLDPEIDAAFQPLGGLERLIREARTPQHEKEKQREEGQERPL
jgi:hypothetical protein